MQDVGHYILAFIRLQTLLRLTCMLALQVMLQEKNQLKAEMDRYENIICASQATHSLTASTVGA